MKVVIQRCNHASVSVDNKIVNEVGFGLLLFACFEEGDNFDSVERALQKILNLRLFDDSEGKMNLSVKDIEGEILCISQFTLSWDGSKGNRPSFDKSMKPGAARLMYESFCQQLGENVLTKKGVFGATMDVAVVNNGPVTFSLSF